MEFQAKTLFFSAKESWHLSICPSKLPDATRWDSIPARPLKSSGKTRHIKKLLDRRNNRFEVHRLAGYLSRPVIALRMALSSWGREGCTYESAIVRMLYGPRRKVFQLANDEASRMNRTSAPSTCCWD